MARSFVWFSTITMCRPGVIVYDASRVDDEGDASLLT